MKNYKVYLIRERDTEKVVYVGMTARRIIDRLWELIKVWREPTEKFTMELVQEYLSQEEAGQLELMLIEQYGTCKTGRNKSPGTKDGKAILVSDEHLRKNRIARLGSKNTEEHNKTISAKNSKPVMCLETGVVYKSARDAAEKLNLSYSKISLVCNGKRTMTGGYHFIFSKKR